MARQTEHGISYVDETWNPIRGCDPTMPCAPHCWARRMQVRHEGNPRMPHLHGFVNRATGNWTGKVSLIESELERPLHWKRPRRVAVCFMGDLFLAPSEVVDRVVVAMAICQQHEFFVSTKQARAMYEYFYNRPWRITEGFVELPLPNVRLGISARNQVELEARAPWLQNLATAGWRTWINLEPLLGPVTFRWAKWDDGSPNERRLIHAPDVPNVYRDGRIQAGSINHLDGLRMIANLVVVGGESGPGAAPMHPQWARVVRDECVQADVGFEFKQFGDWAPREPNFPDNQPMVRLTSLGRDGQDLANAGDGGDVWMQRVGKRAAGRLLDGREWNGDAR